MNAQPNLKPPTVINGINVDDLLGLIDDVRNNSCKAATNWQVTTAWRGQTHSRSVVNECVIGGEHISRSFAIDIDEPQELGGANRFANPQEYLLAAINACMTVGYVAQCALRGITLDSLEIKTEGDIDLRGFLGLDPSVPNGYGKLCCTVRIKGNASESQFREIHAAVLATSPNFYNISRPIHTEPILVIG